MNVVFVGAGAVFGYHSQQWRRAAPEGSRFYVVEPNDANARFAKMERLQLEEAANIADCAMIMTPSYIRWEICQPFIERNIPIAVEKPLTIHWDEIDRFQEAAKRSFIVPVVNIRQLKKIEEMRGKIEQNSDAVTYIHSWKTRYRPSDYYDDWHGKWATDGGVLAQQGFHCLDLVCWLGGPIESLRATGSQRKHEIECEDTASVDIVFRNGMRGRVDCTTAAPPGENMAGLIVTINGEKYETRGGMFAGGTPGHTILARRFFHALRNDLPPPITVESVVPSLHALHAAYVSIERGEKWVAPGVRSRLGKQTV